MLTKALTAIKVEPPEGSDPLALFFGAAYTIASLKLTVSAFQRLDLPITKYKAVAASLRADAATMRLLNFRHSSGNLDFGDQHFKNVEEAADFCDGIVDVLSQVRAALGALVIKRSFGKRQERAYVRMLAVEMHNLFGQLLAGTLARVTNVALVALREKVTATHVNNWARPAS